MGGIDEDGNAVSPSVASGHMERSLLVFNGGQISADAVASEELDALDEAKADSLVKRVVSRRVLEGGVDTGSMVDQEGNAHSTSTADGTEEGRFVVEIASVDFSASLKEQPETVSVSTDGSFVESSSALSIARVDDGLSSFVDQPLGDAFMASEDSTMQWCPPFSRDGIEHQRRIETERRLWSAIEDGREIGRHPLEKESAMLLLMVVMKEEFSSFETTVETSVVEWETAKG